MPLMDISRIRTDGGMQHRAKRHDDAIEDYAAAYLDGKKLPPVDVVHDGTNFWMWNGFHRLGGAKAAGRKAIEVSIQKGTQRDAFILSLSANEDNGIRRSADDKRNAVKAALQDEEIAAKSDREVARLCLVSGLLVKALRSGEERVVHSRPPAKDAQKTGTSEGDGGESGGQLDESGANVGTPRPGANVGSPGPGANVGTRSARQKPETEPGDVVVRTPGTKPVGSLETIVRERDQLQDAVRELTSNLETTLGELAALQQVVEADDQIAAALAEASSEREMRKVAEERVAGLMEERNAAIRAAKMWKKKAGGK